MHIHIYTHTHTHTHTHIYTYIYIYIYTHTNHINKSNLTCLPHAALWTLVVLSCRVIKYFLTMYAIIAYSTNVKLAVGFWPHVWSCIWMFPHHRMHWHRWTIRRETAGKRCHTWWMICLMIAAFKCSIDKEEFTLMERNGCSIKDLLHLGECRTDKFYWMTLEALGGEIKR